ncbi:NmrA family NAD(P)-binding protein [Tunicatimonas pelagia]|uniref:NmrA family NAD(P)-binding protein n=1 Tax=Tunicatimonas pelagia TaxID=931531 RepID=UPI002664F9DC|nr:NAD(P)H-binding protein [Tunicatimonas pelagia]WKN41688.1 NAD(P)H-binding protein [Tunicatimonas pelagia]
MKITLTGSLGRIGKPLVQKLMSEGHTVTVISSNSARSKEIEALGAIPAIGALQDTDFLASTFTGADVIYAMAPPANYFDQSLNLFEYFKELGNSFDEAVQKSGVKRVINLSSIGAHLEKGNGILEGTYYVENSLNSLPEDVAVTHIRPTEIYYNLFQFIDLIKNQGIMGSNLNKNGVNVWVSTEDIAAAVVEEISNPFSGRKVRYVASEELTYQEVAATLGSAIGKPDLKWVTITDNQLYESLKSVGMQPAIAEKMVEMYAAIRSGLLYEDYNLHKPETLGQVKMKDFAQEFAAVYHQK